MTPNPSTETACLTIHLGDGVLTKDMIPPAIKQLKLKAKIPKGRGSRRYNSQFNADAITGLTHLMIRDLNPNMQFCERLEMLLITEYSGKQPLPQVQNVYVHAVYSDWVTNAVEHYLFFNGKEVIPDKLIKSDAFETDGLQSIVYAFGKEYTVIKRKPVCPSPLPKPEPLQAHKPLPAPVLPIRCTLNVGNGVVTADMIPLACEELTLKGKPTFEAKAITSLDTLVITNLNKHMAFPETLNRLVIDRYSESVPLPTVQNVFIASSCRSPVTHYAFTYVFNMCMSDDELYRYSYGPQFKARVRDRQIIAAKRTVKDQTKLRH